MDVAQIRAALAGSRFGDVRGVDETGSTNDDVLALARAGEPEGVVLVADHQTAGRGRLDRTWDAPPGSSLLASILTRPPLPVEQVHLVAMAVGVAAADACREVVAAARASSVGLKWPNDIVVDQPDGTRKLGGILAESIVEGDRIDAVVVGIGCNLNWPRDLPPELAEIAIALNHLVGRPVDRDAWMVSFLQTLAERYDQLTVPEGRAALAARYRELSRTLGRRVRVDLGGETVVGDAIDISAEGHLLVVDDCPDRPREIAAGDVVHLRAGD